MNHHLFPSLLNCRRYHLHVIAIAELFSQLRGCLRHKDPVNEGSCIDVYLCYSLLQALLRINFGFA